jgi:RNA polymerase sigma-70 factor, ECF subfamily
MKDSLLHHSDESLLHQIARRDADAFEVFYDRHAQMTYNLIMRIVREPALADEVLQETFWQVWKKAIEFRGEGIAAAWLYRIARNHSLDHLRHQKARPQPVTTALLDESVHRAAHTLTHVHAPIEHIAEQAQARQRVHQALNHIPAEQRKCVELAYFEGMSQREIAEHIDTPIGTVKTRMRLGLEKLGRLLRVAGLEAEDVSS